MVKQLYVDEQPMAAINEEQVQEIKDGKPLDVEFYEHSGGAPIHREGDQFVMQAHGEPPKRFSRLEDFIK